MVRKDAWIELNFSVELPDDPLDHHAQDAAFNTIIKAIEQRVARLNYVSNVTVVGAETRYEHQEEEA
jgi:hypothetical protein